MKRLPSESAERIAVAVRAEAEAHGFVVDEVRDLDAEGNEPDAKQLVAISLKDGDTVLCKVTFHNPRG